MVVIAAAASLFTVIPWLRCDRSRHGHYFAGKAAASRRFERWARQQANSARLSAEECRRAASIGDVADRDRLESAAKRYEEEVLLWQGRADEATQDARWNVEMSKKSGDRLSELPAAIRLEMKPGELEL